MQPSTYLFVIPWASHHAGGVNIVVKSLAATLRVETPLAPLIAIDTWGAFEPHLADGDLPFQFGLIGAAGIGARVRALLALPVRLARLRRLLVSRNVAVANFHYVTDAAFGVAILKRLGLYRGRLVLSFHGEDAKPPADRVRRLTYRLMFANADALVAVSHGLAHKVSAAFDLPLARVSVVYNGVDQQVFRPGASSPSIAVAAMPTPFLLSVGSYIPRKNPRCLLDAFARIAAANPALHLCFAGADGPERLPLLAEAARLGLAERVHCLVSLGVVETAHLMASALAVVQTARAEGLPLAVIEAGAVGTPLAVSRIIGHDELIEDGPTGRMFESDDAAGCARVLAELLADPATARSRADAFRRRIERDFTWSVCAGNYLRVLGLAPPTLAATTAAQVA